MAGRDQDLLQPAQALDVLGMNPELIGQLNPQQEQKQRQWHTEQGQRQIKRPVEGGLQGAFAQRRRQVEVFTGVMGLMGAPQQVVAMQAAVRPVEAQVHRDKAAQPDPGRAGIQLQHARMLIQPGVRDQQQQAQRPLKHQPQHGTVDAGYAVRQTPGVTPRVAFIGELQQHQQDVQRQRHYRDIHAHLEPHSTYSCRPSLTPTAVMRMAAAAKARHQRRHLGPSARPREPRRHFKPPRLLTRGRKPWPAHLPSVDGDARGRRYTRDLICMALTTRIRP